MKPVILVVAYTHETRAIGGGGGVSGLPWDRLREDMKRFKKLTMETSDPTKKNAIVMGRKTWDTLPGPLPGRHNEMVSRKFGLDFQQTLGKLQRDDSIEKIFIIGGGEIYKVALESEVVDEIYATEIYKEFEGCDTYFPKIGAEFGQGEILHVVEDEYVKYKITKYTK